MASEAEPAKLLLPYLQRADELQKHEPLVAYYCRLYAMERGLRIPQNERTKTTNSLLISLMNQLEKDKKSLTLGPEDNLYVEGFALNVFGKADKQDRAGRADLSTAKTFYAASIFFEILNQFGALQPDLEQKQKYAVWKAADIRKALKEGRKPNPGPPSGEDDLSLPSSGSYDIGPSEFTPINPRTEPDPSNFHDSINNDQQHSPNLPPPSKFHDDSNDQHPNFQYRDNKPNDHHFQDDNFQYRDNKPNDHHFQDDNMNNNNQSSINLPSVPRTYPSSGYSPQDFNRPETSSEYPQPYQNQSFYSQGPHQNLPPQNYPPENPFHSNPHFQSYPSVSDTSLPAVPPHHPSYYQGSSDTTNYAPPPPPPAAVSHYPATQFQPGVGRTGSGSESGPAPVSAPAKSYEFDGSYQAPPEKIAEAHKAARLAVGALAFDDVSVAVDYLRRSLELLTNPSAKMGH